MLIEIDFIASTKQKKKKKSFEKRISIQKHAVKLYIIKKNYFPLSQLNELLKSRNNKRESKPVYIHLLLTT